MATAMKLVRMFQNTNAATRELFAIKRGNDNIHAQRVCSHFGALFSRLWNQMERGLPVVNRGATWVSKHFSAAPIA